MSSVVDAITKGWSTNQGMNAQGVMLLALGFVHEMPEGHVKEAAFFVVISAWAFVSFITRGSEAGPGRVDEPVDDIDHDLSLQDVLAESRAGLTTSNLINTPLGFVSAPSRSISQKGIDLIKEFEGCKLTAYWDKWGKVWTIGYGWTNGVKKGDVWTQAKAEWMLKEGVVPYARAVSEAVGDSETSQNQFDAMTSLCYNIGPPNFRKSSVLRYHKLGDRTKAAQSFLMWNKSGGKVLNGLTRRRRAEANLYVTR